MKADELVSLMFLESIVSSPCSPFREKNDMRAVNRMCERFCACESHTCLSH